jgi:SAM-dependent methyltransferase
MSPPASQSHEARYYFFGLQVGLHNLLRNGLRLGAEKTLGKILQPVNSYTRFPEYSFMGQQIECELSQRPGTPVKILDVSSPKLFGLYVASHFDVEITLTDIDDPSVAEAQCLWEAIRARAKGRATFAREDARTLGYSSEGFEIVYSMSVIEHVEGGSGDKQALREMMRVLKPGGMLLVTVPTGPRYVEQQRAGFEGAARKTGNEVLFFFQRIYDVAAIEERIVKTLFDAELLEAHTISRKDSALARRQRSLSPNMQALLGGLNPFFSHHVNEDHPGLQPCPGNYGPVYSGTDSYGDMLLAFRKKQAGANAVT